MNISRFFGATNREAMRQVRLALGPDALIVSNKRVNGGVEILATDQTPDAPSAASAPQMTVSRQTPMQAPPPPSTHSRPSAAMAAPVAAPRPDLMGAIGELRGSLESRIDELLWGNQLRRAPEAVTLFQSLLRFGFSTALLRAMLKRLPEQLTERAALQWARAELIKHLPVLDSEDALWRPGLALALVGPTGVGKTTTLAKLAARCVRRAGPGGLVLLTTDTYRIGAHEQLKIYGQMLRVPVHVVQDIHEMRRIVQDVRPEQTILIDNVGISQRDRYVTEQAALLAGAGRPVSRLLVLNASSHGDTLDEVARSYAGDGGTPLRGCIITKIDEASRLGAALDTAIRYQLPIHYVSNGQKVPEHLLHLSAEALVDHALTPAQGARNTLYAPTEADLAALLSMTRPPEDVDGAVASRQKAMLPRLLASSLGGGDALRLEDLQAAVAALDEDPLLSEGYDFWRGQAPARLPMAAESIAHLQREARAGLDDSGPALAVHGRIPLQMGARRGVWHASAWCRPDGLALAAAAQQLAFAEGWYASGRPHQPTAPSSAEALLAQISTAAAAADPGQRLVHVFEGGNQGFWRLLEGQGIGWLAQCGSRIRVMVDDEAATLSAAARRFPARPLEASALKAWPVTAGLTDEGVALWLGIGPVWLQARGLAPLQVHGVCLRAIDRHDGREVRSWFALASSGLAADRPDLPAAALLARLDCQAGWRQAVALFDESGESGEALLDRSVAVAQFGLAARRLWRDPGLARAAQACARMLGRHELKADQASAGLRKLYALKDMLG